MESNSEKIFPKTNRLITNWSDRDLSNKITSSTQAYYLLERYHKALEVAELQVIQLEDEIECLKHIEKLCDKTFGLLSINADKRFELALKHIQDNSILYNGDNIIIIDNALKIAAHGE